MGIFITASPVKRVPHLLVPECWTWFAERLRSRAEACGRVLVAWVVLKEHYHVVFRPTGEAEVDAIRWVPSIHSESSLQGHREESCAGRQVWYAYWDRALWTEGDFWSRINNVYGHPVKHGYVTGAFDYPWSSLRAGDEGWVASGTRFPMPRKLPGDGF